HNEDAACNSDGDGIDREEWGQEDAGENALGDEETDRIEAHGFEGVEFFVDFHSAEFSGEGGTGTAGEDDSSHEAAEFARHDDAQHVGDKNLSTEHGEWPSGFKSDNETEQQADQGDDGEGINAGLLEDTPNFAPAHGFGPDEVGGESRGDVADKG